MVHCRWVIGCDNVRIRPFRCSRDRELFERTLAITPSLDAIGLVLPAKRCHAARKVLSQATQKFTALLHMQTAIDYPNTW